jgi:hypothetical protein
MSEENSEDSNYENNPAQETENQNVKETGTQNMEPPKSVPEKSKKPIRLYIELGILIVGIILIIVASVQIKSIAHVKWNDFSEIALPLSIIFIASPAILYFKRLRSLKPGLVVLIIVLIGIILLYYLLAPYKMFTVHFGLLGDVIVEYLIGIFFVIFMVSHLTKVHLLKNKN